MMLLFLACSARDLVRLVVAPGGGAVAIRSGGCSCIACSAARRRRRVGAGSARWRCARRSARRVRDVEVPLAAAAQALDGFTIVQLTDVHVGPTLGARLHRGASSRAPTRSTPDLVAITGDLVDGSVDELRDARGAARASCARKHGVFFVTGNHEYYSGADEWMARAAAPRRPRAAQRARRASATGATASISPASTTAARVTWPRPRRRSAARARRPRSAARELVLLAHQPRAIARGGRARRRAAALGAHARRPDLAVELPRAAAAAVRRRAGARTATPSSTSAAAPATGARRCASARPRDHAHQAPRGVITFLVAWSDLLRV